jgi:peptide/nickel transport system ATP-binding protein
MVVGPPGGPARPVLSIRNLDVVTEAGDAVVRDVRIEVHRGEVLAVIGASGSGKTTLALAALGRVRPGLKVAGGSVEVDGEPMLGAPAKRLNSLRGRVIAYVAQSAAASFNPRFRLERQVIESALLHGTQSRREATERAKSLFSLLNLPPGVEFSRRFPHQVSGGQLQRFMIAMAMQERPLMLVCDEPTSALDVTTQVEVVTELKRAIEAQNTAALFISHDLAIVAQLATRIAVMRGGRIVETGTTDQILTAPREAYTRELLEACRQFSPEAALAGGAERSSQPSSAPAPALESDGILAGYGRAVAGKPVMTTLRDVSLRLGQGEILALIGESGSGKSTLARVLAGLLPATRGTVRHDGKELAPSAAARSRDEKRWIQLVYQSADTALNPRQSVRRILGRTLAFYHGMRGERAERRMAELLRLVHLPGEHLERAPMELSGGEKQRVNLARALAAEPRVLICDEITSALDTVVAEGILELIADLRARLGLSILFISHDLATVASLADRVMVLRSGQLVEEGATASVMRRPGHAYTRLLVASAPRLRRGWLEEAAAARQALARDLEREGVGKKAEV